MNSRKLSLSMAKQYRLCPPPHIELNPMYEEDVKHHRSSCPYCSESQAEDAAPMDALAERIQSLSLRPVEPEGMQDAQVKLDAGSISLVRSEIGTWRDGYYYNPPAVLIIRKTGAISDDVLVAQIYHDITLAGPGDLILESDRSPVGEIFVEAWNTYTLRSRDLTGGFGKVDISVVDAIKALEEDPGAYPDWASCPKPMEEEDPRIYFRDMEVEVGFTFSSMSVYGLIQELEKPPLRLVYKTVKEALKDIRENRPEISWPLKPGTVDLVLATARFPAEQYARAAATADRELFKANLITTRSGRVAGIEPVEGEILQKKAETESLVIGGRVFVPHGLEVSRIVCFLEAGEGHLVSPDRDSLKWDHKGSFIVMFRVSPSTAGRLFLAVIREAQDV